MFKAKTTKIETIAKDSKAIVTKLESIFGGETRVYIDYANVRPWSNKLKWHIDLKRLKQFFDSFDTIKAVNFYNGYLQGSEQSKREIKEVEDQKYVVRTKPVKIMRISIDASSLANDYSPDLLKNFIRKPFLKTLALQSITDLNTHLKNLNQQGILFLEDKKCNFDVEIGVDMLLDLHLNKVETFVLWSGDSDFSDPVQKIIQAGKRVVLFATAGRISRELSDLRSAGLQIFDIRDLKDFICWPRESRG